MSSLHPGADAAAVRAATAWDIRMAAPGVNAPPQPSELAALRALHPPDL
jgi:hypothetical protein